MVIGIDPGRDGAIVGMRDCDSVPDFLFNMGNSDAEITDDLRMSLNREGASDTVVYLEAVGHYVSGNSAPSAVKFADHCGFIRGVLTTLDAAIVMTSPQKWMRPFLQGKISYPDTCDSAGKRKTYRKNLIKRRADELFPACDVTRTNADAFGLLWYGLNDGENNK